MTTAYLLILISLGYFATDIYLPSLPALTAYFRASENEVQMTLFFYMLSFSLAPIIFGPLSDHIGRKKVILCGIAIGIAATAGCLFASSIHGMIAFRFLQGIGCGAVMICARATSSDLFTGKALAKQISQVTMFMPLALALAPTIGGFLQEEFQWQSVFIFLICYLLLILVLASVRPESLKQPSNKKISQIFSTYRAHLHNKRFIFYGLNFVFPAIGMFAYLTTSPFLFQEIIGLSPIEYGSLALYIGGMIMASSYLNSKLINRFETGAIIFFGAGLVLFAGLLLLLFHWMGILTTWSLLTPTLIYYSCLPFCVANSASKAMNFVTDHFGAATAVLTTFQFLAGTLGSFIFSVISDDSALPLSICFIGVGLLSLLNLTIARRQEKQLSQLATNHQEI